MDILHDRQRKNERRKIDTLRLYEKMHEQKLFEHKDVKENTGLGIVTIWRWRHGVYNPRPSSIDRLDAFLVKVLRKSGLSKSLVLSR